MKTKKICILGEGAWGTAIALLLADNGYTVYLWCYHAEVAQEIQSHRTNSRYLPGFTLPTSIIATIDLEYALSDTQWIFEAIPVKYMRSIMQRAALYATQDQKWVILSKGIEQDTFLLPTQIIDDIFDISVQKVVCVGPSFAHEVARKQPTAVMLASADYKVTGALRHILENDYFRPYSSLDIIGVQYSAALKNVITLAVGMLDGAGYGDNTKAFFMTRGLHEISELVKKMGGTQETVYGLSGVGDLVLTSMGALSRNLEVGRQLGMGESLDTIIQRTGSTPEGVNTVVSVQQLTERLGCVLPLCRGVYEVIYKNKSVAQMIESVMQQSLE